LLKHQATESEQYGSKCVGQPWKICDAASDISTKVSFGPSLTNGPKV
jgi:hypothetical protein